MTKRRIVIKGGEICGFHDEVSFEGLELESHSQERVSRIVPINLLLRGAFYLIRGLCSDQSKLAAWTRGWGCQWQVVIDGEVDGPFSDRAKAIEFEKEKIYNQGKLSAGAQCAPGGTDV